MYRITRDPSSTFKNKLASWLVTLLNGHEEGETSNSESGLGQDVTYTCEGKSATCPRFFSEWLNQRLENMSANGGIFKIPGKSRVESTLSLLKEKLQRDSMVAWAIVSVLHLSFKAHWPVKYRKLSSKSDYEDTFHQDVLDWLPLIEGDKWIAVIKFQLNFLFCKVTGQELPKAVPSHFKDGKFLRGCLGKLFRNLMAGNRPRNWSWRWTVLQGIKKGLPQMTTIGVTKAARTHQERLTRQKESLPGVLESVRRMAREVIGTVSQSDWNKYLAHSWFSDRASFHRPYGDGPLKELIDLHYDRRVSDFSLDDYPELSWSNFLWGKPFPKTKLGKLEQEAEDAARPFDLAFARDQLYLMAEVPLRIGSRVQEFRLPEWAFDSPSTCSQILNLVWHGQIQGGISRVKFILEPLKVRPITAGDLETNGIYQRLQKVLWKRLQKFPQFSLTGESLNQGHLKWLFHKSNQFFNQQGNPHFLESEDWLYASGDFSAATDQLHGDLTRACVDEVSGDHLTREVLLNGLCRNKIFYHRDPLIAVEDLDAPSIDMTNGQLMGCVFSFIFLCIINAAVFRFCLEQNLEESTGVQTEIPIRDLPVLINGDDIGFYCDQEFHNYWCSVCLQSGLEPSLGKNFLSRDFVTLNSKLYRIHPLFLEDWEYTDEGYESVDCFVSHEFELVPYLNMSFLTGISKGGSDTSPKCSVRDIEREYRRQRKKLLTDSIGERLPALSEFRQCSDPESLIPEGLRDLFTVDDWRDLWTGGQAKTDDRETLKVIRGSGKKVHHQTLKIGASILSIRSGIESVESMWFSGERFVRKPVHPSDFSCPAEMTTGSWIHAKTVLASYRATIKDFRQNEIRDSKISSGPEFGGLDLESGSDGTMGVAVEQYPKGGIVFDDHWDAYVAPWKRCKKMSDFEALKLLLLGSWQEKKILGCLEKTPKTQRTWSIWQVRGRLNEVLKMRPRWDLINPRSPLKGGDTSEP